MAGIDSGTPGRGRVELHVHLEGALSASRALQLAGAAPDAPPPPHEGITRHGDGVRWSYRGLLGFLELFGWATRLLRSPQAYVAVFEDLVASYRQQGVQRAEVFVAIGQMLRVGADPRAILPRLAAEARRVEEAGGPSLWFVADATRQWGVRAAERVLDTALAFQQDRIVGFGMGGDERAVRAREFRHVYRRAAENGLGLCCHAGEGTSADSVREVLEELEVLRVGHGIAAVEDPALMTELREEGIVLEVCPTSNERTGVWDPNGTAHPLLRLLENGVPVVLGSDDPAFFGCTLASEFERAAAMGIPAHTLDALDETARVSGFG